MSFDSAGEPALPSAWLKAVAGANGLRYALLISAMPRGGLSVVLASVTAPPAMKEYGRQHYRADRVVWRALAERRPVRSTEVQAPEVSAAFWTAVLLGESTANGRSVRSRLPGPAAAVPLDSPLFRDYPAALLAIRPHGAPEFDEAALGQLAAAALDATAALRRECRMTPAPSTHTSVGPEPDDAPAPAFFAVTDDGTCLFASPPLAGEAGPLALLRGQVVQVTTALAAAEGDSVEPRATLALPTGLRVVYRAARHDPFPALAERGAVTLFARAPRAAEWSGVQPALVSADVETARYVPVVHRLTREFAQPPGLDDVARSVDLSRFHFHRRFSELIGATPKHLVLDCQIEVAQRHLREGRLTLAEIAEACGFAHQSHFTARFKQATGMTPTQWLRMAQGSGSGDA